MGDIWYISCVRLYPVQLRCVQHVSRLRVKELNLHCSASKAGDLPVSPTLKGAFFSLLNLEFATATRQCVGAFHRSRTCLSSFEAMGTSDIPRRRYVQFRLMDQCLVSRSIAAHQRQLGASIGSRTQTICLEGSHATTNTLLALSGDNADASCGTVFGLTLSRS